MLCDCLAAEQEIVRKRALGLLQLASAATTTATASSGPAAAAAAESWSVFFMLMTTLEEFAGVGCLSNPIRGISHCRRPLTAAIGSWTQRTC